ncbi:Transcriptional regulator of nonfermentable carbon utilization [Coemansia sp. RSA 2611]|nr:Transcriptional regulator of nonfermentable carbon utilization [Coemansia sp. RSA 2611]
MASEQQSERTSIAYLSSTPANGAADPLSEHGNSSNGARKARRKKHKTVRACNHCQKSHLTCDDSRPCARCVKRGLGDTCVDGARKKAKYLQDADPLANSASNSPDPAPIVALAPRPEPQRKEQQRVLASATLSADGEPGTLRATSTATNFGSEAATLEYAIMSNMMAQQMLSSAPPMHSPADGMAASTISIPSSLWAAPAPQLSSLQSPPPPTASSFDNQVNAFNNTAKSFDSANSDNVSAPTNGSHSMRGRQLSWQGQPLAPVQDMSGQSSLLHGLSAAAMPPQAQIVADDAQHPLSRPPTSGPAVYGLNPVYAQSPADVYSSVTEPYKYYNGFHFFFKHISTRMSRQDVLRVSRAIAHFRPSLVALLRNLTREDLMFMEKSLRRALLEYEKLIGFVGTPTVVWRRTGEIALVGKEFSILTQWDRQELLAGNRFIFELMDAESAVVYWEQFAVHAFENSEHAVMSECRLVRPDGVTVPCAFSFTIKRDLFGIPMAIVGNFLPIL